MTVRLTGETTGRPSGERVPIEIDFAVRIRLQLLLWRDEMRGVSYSEFITRAIDAAEAELSEQHDSKS